LIRAKDYARRFAPDLGWLDAKVAAKVNVNDLCNAYSQGSVLAFFRESEQCENMARLADVVYHEFGHSLHASSLIPGVGAYESALGEGVADYLAVTMTGDPGMGRGFFYSEEPLRQLDPKGYEYRWPDDITGAHDTGLIIGGALWDLRQALRASLGEEPGVAVADELYYQAIRRAVDIPSMYVEILAADDDDGDLANGTPHVCAINTAFGRHGLRPVGAVSRRSGPRSRARTASPCASRPRACNRSARRTPSRRPSCCGSSATGSAGQAARR
ncbi:MAG: hypothetical protein HY744_06845, partial [Deltaproteobacteria bacterium]|nr:hypothetical protein [Deltaproteobacteria bacterium]